MKTNLSNRELFLRHQGQTSAFPVGLEISRAENIYLYGKDDKSYIDLISGIAVSSLGHNHPKIVEAVKKQAETHMHVMVYGEFIQKAQLEFSQRLAGLLPSNLNCVYTVNSGTEAIEGALKLAKRATGRSEIISAFNAYHGNTMGSMSVMGYEERKQAFRPLLPDVRCITFNKEEDLDFITSKTAGVILETIQGGAGFIEPKNNYLAKVRAKCDAVGALLILDEIQPGIGRTGKLFGFEHYNCIPDILVTGKGLGGGMPIGAFTSSKKLMDLLAENPKLGHITTFGGHPVIAASALATLTEITESKLMAQTLEKEQLIRKLLVHPLLIEIRGKGLMLALIMPSDEITNKVILAAQEQGLILFWLLFEPKAIRITPPLTISNEEIIKGCAIIITILNSIQQN